MPASFPLRVILLMILTLGGVSPGLAEPAAGSASAALLAVPVRYNNGIIQVVGKNGAPLPSNWLVYARDVDGGGTTMQLTFANGQMIHEQVSVRPAAMFQESAFILQETLPVDAEQAFAIAQKTAAAQGHTMAAANYELARQGSDEPPVWTVQCLDENGKVLGTVQIVCTDGTVLSATGFR